MYWLNIEAPTHSTNENWKTYVARCEAWVRIDFDSLVRSTDFMKEAESFGPLRARAFFGDTSLLDSLVFVAYFENESGESI